jgi:hypothetical protein
LSLHEFFLLLRGLLSLLNNSDVFSAWGSEICDILCSNKYVADDSMQKKNVTDDKKPNLSQFTLGGYIYYNYRTTHMIQWVLILITTQGTFHSFSEILFLQGNISLRFSTDVSLDHLLHIEQMKKNSY